MPCLLMLALAIIRMQVPTVASDETGMLKKKYPIFPGTGIEDGAWCSSTSCDSFLNDNFRPLAIFSDYGESHNNFKPKKYDVGYDKSGPQFYAPTHCL